MQTLSFGVNKSVNRLLSYTDRPSYLSPAQLLGQPELNQLPKWQAEELLDWLEAQGRLAVQAGKRIDCDLKVLQCPR
jgi:hypothetical protein